MILIVASNAPGYDLGAEDKIYCDGTDDQEQFAEAFALADEGGPIYLSIGDFYLTAPIKYPAIPAELIGRSAAFWEADEMATRLHFTFAAQGSCVMFADADPPTNAHIPQGLYRCGIIGDGTNTQYGIHLRNHDCFKTVDEVSITGITDVGVYSEASSSQCIFRRVFSVDVPYGFRLYALSNRYESCQVKMSTLGGTAGFELHDTGSLMLGCVAETYNTGFAIREYGLSNTLMGCYAEACDVDLYVWGAEPYRPRHTTVVGGFLAGKTEIREGFEVRMI